MAEPSSDTRARIVAAAGGLFRRQGYTGTGLQQIAAGSDARVGSIYHFFDSKEALGASAVRVSGAAYGAMVMGFLTDRSQDPIRALGEMFDQAAADLAASDYADACPIATVALEVASSSEPIRHAVAEVFDVWLADLAQWCHRIVDDPRDARDLAVAILAALEGAFILCRAQRTRAPLHAAGRTVARLAAAMSDGP